MAQRGVDFLADDALMVLDTCRVASSSPLTLYDGVGPSAKPAASGAYSNTTGDLGSGHGRGVPQRHFPNAGRLLVTPVHRGELRSLTYSFGDEPVTAAAGVYRLCWCAGRLEALNDTSHGTLGARGRVGCSAAEDFALDLGALRVVGPQPLTTQARTCVSGQTCLIDGIHVLDGTAADQLVLLDTCAQVWPGHDRSADRPVLAAPRMPRAGRNHPSQTWQRQTREDGGAFHSVPWVADHWIPRAEASSFFWGSTALTAPGGVYRLCWCAGGFTCSQSEDFKMDVGELHLIGPRLVGPFVTPQTLPHNLAAIGPHNPLSQDRTCVAGQTCALDGFTGHMLQDGDRVLLLDTSREWG